MDTRQVETQAAAQNPNIISTLVGGQPQTQMSPQSSPQGGLPQELMKPAQDLSSRLYGSGFVDKAGSDRESAMKQLFMADQKLDQGYNPLPSPQWYVQNPADNTSAYADFGSGVAGMAGSALGAQGSAEKAYQAAITGVMDRLVSFMQMQEDRKAREEDRKFEREKFEWQKSQAGGGTGRSVSEILGLSPEAQAISPDATGVEPAPTGVPSRTDIPFRSPQGQWEFRGGKWESTDLGETETGMPTKNQVIQAILSTSDSKERASLEAILPYLETGVDPEEAKQAEGLRGEYIASSKNYKEVRDAYNKISTVSDTGVGDISLITAYMKMIDPSSTVRESEFANAEEAAGYLRKTYNITAKITRGKRLDPATRKDFINEAKGIYKTYNTQQESIIAEYTRLAKQLGVDPSLVLIELGQAEGIGASGSVVMSSPDGIKYTVDQSEVAEAEANGWRKL